MTPPPLESTDHHHHRAHDHPTHASAHPIADLRHEHEIILRALVVAERLGGALAAGEPINRDALVRIVDFLRTFADHCHHGKEEQHLFPVLERRGVPREGGPIGTLLDEHEEGRQLLARMAAGQDGEIAEAIGRYALLLRAHIEKEDTVLFPLAEQILTEAEQTTLLTAFEDVEQRAVGPGEHERLLAELGRLEDLITAGDAEDGLALDVRNLPPRERHPKIFSTFDGLPAGKAFVLINDHDPKPLYYQLAAERPGLCVWEYLEQGPDVWRVRIGKAA